MACFNVLYVASVTLILAGTGVVVLTALSLLMGFNLIPKAKGFHQGGFAIAGAGLVILGIVLALVDQYVFACH